VVKIFSLRKDHLFDQKDEIYHLITWFLNLLIENVALLQSGAKSYERTDSIKLVETTTNLEITKINMESPSY
jgi:putative transposase